MSPLDLDTSDKWRDVKRKLMSGSVSCLKFHFGSGSHGRGYRDLSEAGDGRCDAGTTGQDKECASLSALASLIADYAADRRAADRADGAAIRQYRSGDRADACTERGIPVLLRHSAATAESKKCCKRNRAGNGSF